MIDDTDFAELTASARAAAAALAQAQAAEAADPTEIARLKEKHLEAAAEHAALRRRLLEARGESNRRFAARHDDFAIDYQATPELRTAVRVALALGRPLLLTGEPGTGKTLCAFWLSRLFSDGEVLRFQVRSESRARDLLYTFDAASWFRQSQIEKTEVDKSRFMRGEALGKAFGWGAPLDKPAGEPVVVLIDEVDKAPRDFPNDLLHELDQMSFRIDETDSTLACDVTRRPIVVITSNSERQLPPPFLRRCIVHNIKLDTETVIRILRARLGVAGHDDAFFKAAGSFWEAIDKVPNLNRKPTIDEYWRWLALELRHGRQPEKVATALAERDTGHFTFLGTLMTEADVKKVVF